MEQKRARILCVDDNADSREMLRIVLDGYENVTIGCVSARLTLAKTGRLNLYLLDGRFPDGSDVELCRQIRACDKQTPVFFQSAASGESDINAVIKGGAEVPGKAVWSR